MSPQNNSLGVRLAPPKLEIEQHPNGGMLLRSATPLATTVRCVSDWFERWIAQAPKRTFLAEKRQGEWFHLSYANAFAEIKNAAAGLLSLGLSADSPLLILSDNSIDHAILSFAAMHVGIPVASVSPAYALLSQDHQKLRQIADALKPGAVYVRDAERYAKALKAIGHVALDISAVRQGNSTIDVAVAHRAVSPDTIAKVLFTSGSTGTPKGVINTQRMLTSNQQQSLQVWPFLEDEPPVLLDWLPWNHTFGGNYNLHMVLSNGGTMYIDAGKPVPGLFEISMENLRDVSPTLYCNVPKGYEQLVPFLEHDAALRQRFFSTCRFFVYAGAALSQNIWDRFQALARTETGTHLPLVSSWGSTETAPVCVAVHYPIDRTGVVGLPVPGCELKLVPNQGKWEARVRGPNVTPGYWREAALTQAAFDEEGYYLMGDALRFDDPNKPESGLVFDGRTAENFKLNTGTWVHVGELRLALVTACTPWVQDAVITGHDRDQIGAMLFLNAAGLALPTHELRQHIAAALQSLNSAATGSASRIARVTALPDSPRLDLGETTDKGYINQRMVLSLRDEVVKALYDDANASTIFPLTHQESQKGVTP